MNERCSFDPAQFTKAPQQTEGWIDFRFSPEAVFAQVSNHTAMGDWVPLVHGITLTQPDSVAPGETVIGTARHITFKGGVVVTETVVYWNPPTCYAYTAKGKLFPLKDYVGLFAVEPTDDQSGRLIFREYFDLGRVEQAILPMGAVALTKRALGTLAGLIGGTHYAMTEVSRV